MKFSQLNEAVNAERFAKNVREENRYGSHHDFELKNFAEAEGSTKALEDINRWVGYALEGRTDIVSALFSIVSYKESEERNLNAKNEFKRDSATGYCKTIDVFLRGLTREQLIKLKYS